jgi:hypothetical protein
MATENIVKVRIGVPGPPGAGVSAAQLATFVTLTAANVFTNTNRVRLSSTTAFIVESASATTDRALVVDSTNKEIELWNGADIRGFSNDGTTETWSIDGATGNAQFDGVVTVGGGRVVSDTIEWGFVIDNAGVAITTGVKIDYPVPYNCTVTAWELVADVSGSIVVDIWQDTYANFPPTVADTITGAEKPTLSAVQKNQDTSLAAGAGWALTKGRWLRFNVDSATTVTRVTLKLSVTRT